MCWCSGLLEEVLEIIRHDKEIQNGSTNKVIDLVDRRFCRISIFRRPMTALAMGKEWRKASHNGGQQLTAEFKTLLVRTYSNALTSYKPESRYKAFKMAPTETDVLSSCQSPGNKPVQLDYSLERLEVSSKVYRRGGGGSQPGHQLS